jgi:hypothetical protein
LDPIPGQLPLQHWLLLLHAAPEGRRHCPAVVPVAQQILGVLQQLIVPFDWTQVVPVLQTQLPLA